MTNPTHGTFSGFIGVVEPDLRPACLALRDVITGLHPDFVEIVWEKQGVASYGMGPKKMTDHYAYIGPQQHHVNLGFYHGDTLPDPKGLLEGTGKSLRHVKLRSVGDVESAPIAALIVAAIEERKRALA